MGFKELKKSLYETWEFVKYNLHYMRDYDKCFWDQVLDFRCHPNASPDSMTFIGNLRFANTLPLSLKNKPALLEKWIDIASNSYHDDPLTRLIVGEIMFFFVEGGGLLSLKRLCLLADTYQEMNRNERAIAYYNSALKEAQEINDKSCEKYCLSQLEKLNQNQ